MAFRNLTEMLIALEEGWRPGVGELILWGERSAIAFEEGWLVGDRMERWDGCSPLEFCEGLPN